MKRIKNYTSKTEDENSTSKPEIIFISTAKLYSHQDTVALATSSTFTQSLNKRKEMPSYQRRTTEFFEIPSQVEENHGILREALAS